MTYNVFGGTLSLTQSINQLELHSLFSVVEFVANKYYWYNESIV